LKRKRHMQAISLIVIAGVLLSSTSALGNAIGAGCDGHFPTFVTDICWRCFFPFRIGGITLAKFGEGKKNPNPDDKVSSFPLCFCCPPPFTWIPGIKIGFWEPSRLVEIVRVPFCSPFLGGISLAGIGLGSPGTTENTQPALREVFYEAHYIFFPLLFLLEFIIGGFGCFDIGGLDYLYFSEFDPFWHDDELNFIINPDAILFANPIAEAACAADCVAATIGFPINALFWCAGCQGGIYPLTGSSRTIVNETEASLYVMTRLIGRMHRIALATLTSGENAARGGVCWDPPLPVIKKSQYKFNMMFPFRKGGIGCHCYPLGRSHIQLSIHGYLCPPPFKGNFLYMLWKNRDCCAGICP